ncbi:MAG: hypothetical protein WC692_02835 [Erythrobacter sp.]|jgi:hypothetical protein
MAGIGIAALGGMAVNGLAQQARTYTSAREVYGALEEQPGQDIAIGDATIRLVYADGAPGVDRMLVEQWVRESAAAIVAYFGTFPAKRFGLVVIADNGNRVGHATTWGFDGAAGRIEVGTGAGRDAFLRDWVLVHEMVHAALPSVPRRALWLQEGAATYLEPIARAIGGQLPSDAVWKQAIDGMPNGIPPAGDGGLDGTERWGRLYWGGAFFWLSAEIAVFEATRGKATLRQGLALIGRESGGNGSYIEPEDLMDLADTVYGTPILRPLYARFAETRVEPDLALTFARLGVAEDGDRLRYDDRAELSELRRSMTYAT